LASGIYGPRADRVCQAFEVTHFKWVVSSVGRAGDS